MTALEPITRLPLLSSAAAVAGAMLLADDLSAGSRQAYARDLHNFFDWCASMGIDPLDAERVHVDAYLEQLRRDGAATATRARRHTVLRNFYARAVAEGLRSGSPVVSRPPKVKREQKLGPDRSEALALLAAARTHRVAAQRTRAVALVSLMLMTGLRVSEAVSIDVDQLDTERGHRVLRDVVRKGGGTETIPLAPAVIDAIEALIAERTAGPVFATSTGRRLSRQEAWELVNRLGKRAGLGSKSHPHALRHSFVSLGLDAGVPLRSMQVSAGHADPRTTTLYDGARARLDDHATYRVAAYLAEQE